jgi:hypothetical protein
MGNAFLDLRFTGERSSLRARFVRSIMTAFVPNYRSIGIYTAIGHRAWVTSLLRSACRDLQRKLATARRFQKQSEHAAGCRA